MAPFSNTRSSIASCSWSSSLGSDFKTRLRFPTHFRHELRSSFNPFHPMGILLYSIEECLHIDVAWYIWWLHEYIRNIQGLRFIHILRRFVRRSGRSAITLVDHFRYLLGKNKGLEGKLPVFPREIQCRAQWALKRVGTFSRAHRWH